MLRGSTGDYLARRLWWYGGNTVGNQRNWRRGENRMPSYHYAPEVLEALADHGLRPSPDTEPARVRKALSDLYRYEIRRLKRELLEGRIARPDYPSRVLALRRRSGLLSVPVALWAGRHE